MSSINLSLLPPEEKNRIELDKQAAFLVWKCREAKCGPEAITEQLNALRDEQQKRVFEAAINKYKQSMNVM